MNELRERYVSASVSLSQRVKMSSCMDRFLVIAQRPLEANLRTTVL